MDTEIMDAEIMDAEIMDAGIMDAGIMDAGIMDAGIMDAEIRDAEIVDAEIVDAEIGDPADDAENKDTENKDIEIGDGEDKSVVNIVNEKDLEEADSINYRMNYGISKKYWSRVPANSDAMVFGYENVSLIDIASSDYFLNWLFIRDGKQNEFQGRRCLDCGAGIGRKMHVLERYFQKVDMVEQNKTFVMKVKKDFVNNVKLGGVMCASLQDFIPTKSYDLIWAQWVLMYLRDNDVVAFLRKIKDSLCETGILVIKGNLTDDKGNACKSLMDEKDSSVARPLSLMLDLATRAGFSLLRIYKDKKFPATFEVHTIAFEPV